MLKCCTLSLHLALLLSGPINSTTAMRVLVTGAGGQTGQHIFRKLLDRPGYIPIGTVRSEASRAALIETIGRDKSDS
eukprot:scaffold15431_cov20-Cyclotella_meneghiniana.AAC.1